MQEPLKCHLTGLKGHSAGRCSPVTHRKLGTPIEEEALMKRVKSGQRCASYHADVRA